MGKKEPADAAYATFGRRVDQFHLVEHLRRQTLALREYLIEVRAPLPDNQKIQQKAITLGVSNADAEMALMGFLEPMLKKVEL